MRSRRRVHARLVLLGALAVLASTPVAPAGAQTAGDVFRIVEVTEGAHAALVRGDAPLYAFANSLVVFGTRGVLVVDTQQSPVAARTLLDWIRRRTRLPIRWVVNTHAHSDHTYGNQVYREAFPDVGIVAHETVRRFVLETAPRRLADEIRDLESSIADRRRWLATGMRDDGTPLTDAARAAFERSLTIRSAYLPELRTLRLTPPDVVFRDRLALDLGGRIVELIAMGPAHTAGDVVVHLPGEGIMAVGDLLEEGSLWTACADLSGWARALERIAGYRPRVVLPAHGGIQRGDSLLRDQRAFLRAPPADTTAAPDCRLAP